MAGLGVTLPCQDDAGWKEDKTLFTLLSNLGSLRELNALIASHTSEDFIRTKLESLAGLAVFLEKHCNEEERTTFFERTLPCIVTAAASLKERVPESGVPFLRKQENASLVLGRQLVASLLANAFLCTFPDQNTTNKQQQQQQQEEKETLKFSFIGLYNRLQQSSNSAIAAKLKCILAYFHRLADNKCDISGSITIKRQVLPPCEIPSLSVWQSSQYPLCSFTVDASSKGLEDSGSHTLQVTFSNRCVSGSTLEGGCVQEEIRFSICPELLVSRLVLEPLDDNESVIITGAERFSNYRGYGKTLQYDGESVDTSDRDTFGNILTSIVAIDAVPFHKGLSPEDQYTDHYLLRELNKAFAGFLCQQDRGDLSTALIALRIQNEPTQIALSTDHYSMSFSPSSYGTGILPSQPTDVHPMSGRSSSDPLSPISEAHEPSSPSKSADVSSALNSTVDSDTKAGSDGASRAIDTPEDGRERKVEKYASHLSGSILSSVLPQSSPNTGSGGSVEGNKVVDDFASKLSKSLISGIFSEPTVQRREGDGRSPTAIAEKLTNSLISDVLTQKNSEGSKSQSSPITTADTLAHSIISDVLSHGVAAPKMPPSSPQTVGQPTSPAVEWQVHSYADHVADGIISSVLEASHPPSIVFSKQSENEQGSSSLTGQTITLHEFTDDLVEGVVREGVLIASLQTRGSERANFADDGELGEGTIEEDGREGERGRKVGEKGKSSKGYNAGNLAESLVVQSIQSVLEEGHKRGKKLGEERSDHRFTPGKRAESPLRLGLLRQTLEKPKLTSTSSETDITDLEHTTSSSLLHLAAPSSRMSYAWSIASTRDEESRPVSPTDLDQMALSFVGNMDEYSSMFAELVIRSAIAEVTGNKKYMCHVPNKTHLHPDPVSHYVTGDIHIPVPAIYGHTPDGHHDSTMDTFLCTLGEAEPVGRAGDVRGDRERSPTRLKGLLRQIATGNWGCGAYGGDPQLKSMLQWAAASSAGRPEVIYFPFSDKRMEQLAEVTSHLHTKQWTVGQLLSAIIDFCHLNREERQQNTLFAHLLNQ